MKCPICSKSNHKKLYKLFDDRYGYSGVYDLYICDYCRHGMLDLELTDDEITDLYTKYYPRSSCDLVSRPLKKNDPSRYQAWLKGENANTYKWVPKKSRILDIGCGYGEAMGYHIARGCDAFGVEADFNVIKAKEKYNYNIHVGTFDKKIYETNYFDCVTMDQVIEHLQDPVRQIKDIHEVLKPGGILIISTPNSNSLTAKLLKEKWLHWHVPYHLHFFSKKSIKLLAEKNRVQVNKM